MPSVNVVGTSWGKKTSPANMGLQVDGQRDMFTLYTSPTEGTYTAAVHDIQTVDRPGYKPLTSPRGAGLNSYTFEHRIFHPSPVGNVESEIKWIQKTVSLGKRVRFFNTSGLATDKWYWIQECKFTEEEKGAGNLARSIVVSWTLIEANRANPVNWTRTGPKEQKPIRIEANGPEKATTESSPVKNDKESGAPAGDSKPAKDSKPAEDSKDGPKLEDVLPGKPM